MKKQDLTLKALDLERQNIVDASRLGIIEPSEAFKLYTEISNKINEIILLNELEEGI